MQPSIDEILGILAENDIQPDNAEYPEEGTPEIGEIEDGEQVYGTSIAKIFGEAAEGEGGGDDWSHRLVLDDPRMRDWLDEIRQITTERAGRSYRLNQGRIRQQPPEPHCAWYCPTHFFGHGWGIYIRETCVLAIAIEIATWVNWSWVSLSLPQIVQQLLRSTFYALFLHEQFHHKVESLGFRFLLATGTDRYRPYKRNVYRRTLGTADCLEESLANADSYNRLSEPRYSNRTDPAIRQGLRDYLQNSFLAQPPGYQQASNYLGPRRFRDGLHHLQSQVRDGSLSPKGASRHWSVAPNMITALTDITDEIYVVLPRGARPIFPIAGIDPGATASSQELETALTRNHGYQKVPGGKGSHVKLNRPGSATIILPGNRRVVSPGVVKQVLRELGGYPISKLPDLIAGRLPA